jgi:hypothetical protein
MAKTSVGIDMDKLGKVQAILGTESSGEPLTRRFREVIRIATVRDLPLIPHRRDPPLGHLRPPAPAPLTIFRTPEVTGLPRAGPRPAAGRPPAG